MHHSVHMRMNVFSLNRTGMYFFGHTHPNSQQDHSLVISSNYDFKFREIGQERLLLRETGTIYATAFNDSIFFMRALKSQGFGSTSQIP